jgi:outer membrane protein OmpA-like peptidoglycan-associated protein
MKIYTTIKRFVLLSAALLCGMATWAAQPELTDVEVLRAGDNAEVTFTLTAKRGVVKSNYAMALQPVITDGEHSVSLSPVVIRGKRAERLDVRYEWASGVAVDDRDVTYMRPKETIDYSDEVEFQYWMDGAELQLESITWGCCSSEEGATMLADNILPTEPEYIEIVEYPVIPEPEPESTGDVMARTFKFVVPESEYNPGEPVLYDDDREQAIVIYYRQDNSVIQPTYSTNKLALANLDAAVKAIMDSEDSEISRIVIAGFASPEGYYSRNDRLAWERAVAVKEYIIKNNSIPDADIQLYNGSEDWHGLRMLVEASDMQEKEQILAIIRDYPVLGDDGTSRPRRQELQKLNGGKTYQYLYDNFFPKLRSGAFIRVYYRNTNDQQ